jgi:hypothetical protein
MAKLMIKAGANVYRKIWTVPSHGGFKGPVLKINMRRSPMAVVEIKKIHVVLREGFIKKAKIPIKI